MLRGIGKTDQCSHIDGIDLPPGRSIRHSGIKHSASLYHLKIQLRLYTRCLSVSVYLFPGTWQSVCPPAPYPLHSRGVTHLVTQAELLQPGHELASRAEEVTLQGSATDTCRYFPPCLDVLHLCLKLGS